MTEQQRMEIEVGMRVMVKVASREIPATVVEVGESWFLVRSDSTGREFRTTRVVDILDAPKADDNAEIAQAAADIADEEAATAELRSREENGENADEGGAEDDAEAPQAEKTEVEAPKAESPKDDETKAEAPMDEPKTESPKDGEEKAELSKAEKTKADELPKAEEPPKADVAKDGEAAPAEGEAVALPRKNLSLVDAAVEVLRAEKRPMGVKELVKLATERGLWIPTKAKTPEQSLYGGLYLEMKNSAHPRVRRSAEKGRFELIG